MLISSCCSANPKLIDDRGADTSDIGICSSCGEHCNYDEEVEEILPPINVNWNELGENFFNAK